MRARSCNDRHAVYNEFVDQSMQRRDAHYGFTNYGCSKEFNNQRCNPAYYHFNNMMQCDSFATGRKSFYSLTHFTAYEMVRTQ